MFFLKRKRAQKEREKEKIAASLGGVQLVLVKQSDWRIQSLDLVKILQVRLELKNL